jgi:putative transposase
MIQYAAALERALEVEMADRLGYEHGAAPADGSNHRDGCGPRTVLVTACRSRSGVSCDRRPLVRAEGRTEAGRRLGQLDEAILRLYARGLPSVWQMNFVYLGDLSVPDRDQRGER